MIENNPNEHTSTPTKLPSKARMIPSVGRYRNAVSAWPQVLISVDKISGDPAEIARLQTQYGAPLGSPERLVSMLAIAPALLQSSQPPSEIYARLVWLATKVLTASRTMEGTLTQLPSLLPVLVDTNPEQTGKLVGEIIAGKNGLKQTAENIAVLAENFWADITNSNDEGEQMLANHRTIVEGLKQYAADITAIDGASKAQCHTTTVYASHHLKYCLDALESSSAHVTIAAIMSQLAAALKSMASAWQAVSIDLGKVVTNSSAAQLANQDYLRDVLDLDEAVSDWNGYSSMVQTFIQSLLLTK